MGIVVVSDYERYLSNYLVLVSGIVVIVTVGLVVRYFY